MDVRKLSPGEIPLECFLSFTNRISPTKKRWLEMLSDRNSFSSINFTINRVQMISVSTDLSFNISTSNEIFVGCIKLVLDSESSSKLTRIPIASESAAWGVKGPNKEEITDWYFQPKEEEKEQRDKEKNTMGNRGRHEEKKRIQFSVGFHPRNPSPATDRIPPSPVG
ncbi:hypothetical protein CCACVL1_06361 [Corchorus capsularis]|uniref:Uncharacterized protein n=1 Tax=Corchorus capsularis TaxID=210143 RepID=A0A1R3JG06_COCAP|nr:hypothetical protein CCACVL1_06361 [Corchorus capsularis]